MTCPTPSSDGPSPLYRPGVADAQEDDDRVAGADQRRAVGWPVRTGAGTGEGAFGRAGSVVAEARGAAPPMPSSLAMRATQFLVPEYRRAFQAGVAVLLVRETMLCTCGQEGSRVTGGEETRGTEIIRRSERGQARGVRPRLQARLRNPQRVRRENRRGARAGGGCHIHEVRPPLLGALHRPRRLRRRRLPARPLRCSRLCEDRLHSLVHCRGRRACKHRLRGARSPPWNPCVCRR